MASGEIEPGPILSLTNFAFICALTDGDVISEIMQPYNFLFCLKETYNRT